LRRREFLALAGGLAPTLLAACGGRPLLSPLELSSTIVRPNGSASQAEARVAYSLGSRADVQVELIGPDGKPRTLRERQTRAPDRYEIRFDGTVPTQDGGRRVVPDGEYVLKVSADDGAGRHQVQQATLTVVDADTNPVEVQSLQTDLAVFSPDGDGKDDEVRITYRLTKECEATVYVTDDAGTYYAIDPWTKRRAAYQSHPWDGTTGGRVQGGKLLPNGRYLIHVDARDAAGNFSSATTPVTIVNGGVPRLEITDVRFTPIALIAGGVMDVRITVRNTGTVPIHSWGPAPGYTYSAPEESFTSIRDPADPAKPRFFERRGVWRVGVTWQNAPTPYPLRWGLFAPVKKSDGTDDWDSRTLAPGESVTVEGHVRVNIHEDSRQVRFAASVVQEGVGFGAGAVGEQIVQVGW
jgi:hypothetical protein